MKIPKVLAHLFAKPPASETWPEDWPRRIIPTVLEFEGARLFLNTVDEAKVDRFDEWAKQSFPLLEEKPKKSTGVQTPDPVQ